MYVFFHSKKGKLPLTNFRRILELLSRKYKRSPIEDIPSKATPVQVTKMMCSDLRKKAVGKPRHDFYSEGRSLHSLLSLFSCLIPP